MPRFVPRAALCLLFASVLGACAYLPQPVKRLAARNDIEAQRQAFNQTVAFRRMGELGDLVTDDVQVISPAKTISGRKNLIRAHEALVQKRPDLIQIYKSDKVEQHPTWPAASETGHWTESWQENGESIEMRGSYYAVWKQQKDGKWRLYSQTLVPLSCKGDKYCKSLEP